MSKRKKQRSEAQLREDLAELEALFELQQTRMGEATREWREAHPGNDDTLPDLGDLLAWLRRERRTARAEVEFLRTQAEEAGKARLAAERELQFTRERAMAGLHIAQGYLLREGVGARVAPAGAAVHRAIIEVEGEDTVTQILVPDAEGIYGLRGARYVAAEHKWLPLSPEECEAVNGVVGRWVPVSNEDAEAAGRAVFEYRARTAREGAED